MKSTSNEKQDRSLAALFRDFIASSRALDFQTVFIFISAAVLTTISYYVASRRFFRAELAQYFEQSPLVSVYEFSYWFLAEWLIYFVLPVAVIVFVFRKSPREFGVGSGDWKLGLKITGIFIAIMLPIVWIVSGFESFQEVYPHASIVRTDWNLFLLYEALFFLYFTGWEFIWRGYLLFGLEKRLGGPTAVLVQMIPFVILHNGKPMIETLGAIIAGIALGALALRTRSFWYCVLTHWSVMLLIDLFSTLRYRTAAHEAISQSIPEIFSHLLR